MKRWYILLFCFLFPIIGRSDWNPYIIGGVAVDDTNFIRATIDHTLIDDDITNYVATVDLSGTDFPFADVASSDDVVFFDRSKTRMLPRETDYYDSATEKGVFHVKIPSVSSTEDTVFYIGYNVGMKGADVPDTVWADYLAVYHMEDWSNTDGIITDSAYAVSATINGPSAYRYEGTYDRIYWAYLATDGNVKIRYYDRDTKEWSAASTVGANAIWTGYPDSHGMVSVIVDNSGIIHVAGCDHGGALKYWKSDSAEDISAFTAQTNLSANSTYTSWIKHSSGTLYNFHRQPTEAGNRSPWYFQYFNGSTWSGNIKIIEVDHNDHAQYACYPAYDPSNQRIWLAWRYANMTESNQAKQSVKVYCGYLDVSGGATNHHMFSVDGEDLGASVSLAEANTYCLVTDGTDSFYVWQALIRLDSSGNPYIMYPRSTDTASTEWDTVWKYWTGSAWTSEIHVHDASGWWTHLAFEVSSSTSATAYLMDENRNPRKKVWNGSAWSTASTMPQLADIGASWGFQYVEGGQDDLKLMWDLSGVVVGLDSDDNPVPLSTFSLDAVRDSSPHAYLLRKAGSASPTGSAGSLGLAQSFNGTSDYQMSYSRIFDYDDANGTIQILAKTPNETAMAASTRTLLSLAKENGTGRFDLSLKDANAGQMYDGNLYARIKPDTDTLVCYGDTVIGNVPTVLTPITSTRASSLYTSGQGYCLARKFTTSSSGYVATGIDFEMGSASGNGTVGLEIWTDSSGPGSLVTGASASTSASGEGWKYASFPSTVSLSASTTYWAVAKVSGFSTWSFRLAEELDVGQNRAYSDCTSQTCDTFTVPEADDMQYALRVWGYDGDGTAQNVDAYKLIGCSHDDTTDGFKIWVNGEAETLTYITGTSATKCWFDDFARGSTDATYWYIGKRKDGATSDSYYSNLIDEIRFQSRQRTAAEWKADYHGMVAKDLITYGN